MFRAFMLRIRILWVVKPSRSAANYGRYEVRLGINNLLIKIAEDDPVFMENMK